MLEKFSISTSRHQELVDITSKVEEIINKSVVKNGLINVYVAHATAAIVVIESYDPNICLDFLDALNKAIPEHAGYRHDRIDNNASAHIKAAMLGPSETFIIKDRKLVLGTWQAINLVELDGPKKVRNIFVRIIEK